MDPLGMLEFGSNGVILAVVLGAFKLLESQRAKRNGGTVYDRVSILSERVSVMEANMNEMVGEVEKLTEQIRLFQRDFCVHRENVRLHWARLEGAKDALRDREIKDE